MSRGIGDSIATSDNYSLDLTSTDLALAGGQFQTGTMTVTIQNETLTLPVWAIEREIQLGNNGSATLTVVVKHGREDELP